MAYTQSQLEALEAALASGELSVRFGGPPAREVMYRSIGELQKAIAQVKAELANAGRIRQIQLTSEKGL